MEQSRKIERLTRFGIYISPIKSQPNKAGIPGVPADWGIRGAALIGRGTTDRKMNCEVYSWEFRL